MATSALLLLAVATWWHHRQLRQPPIVTICPHCGDCVQHAPALPFCCPSCRRWWIG